MNDNRTSTPEELYTGFVEDKARYPYAWNMKHPPDCTGKTTEEILLLILDTIKKHGSNLTK